MPEQTHTQGQEPEVNARSGTAKNVDTSTQANGQEPNATSTQGSNETYTAAYVADLRKESANYRTRYNDEKKRADTLQATLDATNLQVKEINIKAAISKATADALYPDVVANLLISSELKLDEQGNPDTEALKTALENTKKGYPALFRSQPTGKQIDAGAAGLPAGTDFNSWLRSGMGIR